MDREVSRLVGASIARMPGSVIEQLLGMRRRIGSFNAARGLRTALLYSGGWFVQWHEGPAEAVELTWSISRTHDGHSHPRVVHRSAGPAALREPVQVAALVGSDKASDMARRLFDLEHEHEAGPLEPAEVWRRLAAPPSGRFAHGTGAEPHRAIAVTSEFTESIELVRALAEHGRVPVNYQRLAGPDPHAADAGAAYVDVGSWGRRTRVQALSRHVLGLGIARFSFSRIDAVVLLANRRPESALGLQGAVGPFLGAVRPEPELHVFGLDGRSHLAAALELVERLHA
ncbi:MAG TPA: hypothetical protein VD970_07600 [Acetobacteraceae bacterium]|nr:hypothetical protein [Acetobacteraceae bacterium]